MDKRKQRPKAGRWGKRKKDDRDWREYDRKKVAQGELLIPLDMALGWQNHLQEQNEGKVGSPFIYPDTFLETLGLWKCTGKIGLRCCQGVGNRLAIVLSLPASPQYSTICRRLRRLGEGYYMARKKSKEGDPIYAVVDGTGLKVCNRGEWMRYKHKGKRKGFIRIVWAVDRKNGEILDFTATTEKTGENKKFKPMIKRLAKNRKINKVGADGAFDTYGNFDLLKKQKIKPAIKIRRNAVDGPPNFEPWMKARQDEVKKYQRWGYKKWAKRREYGGRWISETTPSVFKGLFGEYVYSKGMCHVKSEVGLKVHYLNRLNGF